MPKQTSLNPRSQIRVMNYFGMLINLLTPEMTLPRLPGFLSILCVELTYAKRQFGGVKHLVLSLPTKRSWMARVKWEDFLSPASPCANGCYALQNTLSAC